MKKIVVLGSAWFHKLGFRPYVCGHMHSGYGRYEVDGHVLVNASVLGENYILTNRPIVVDLPVTSVQI